MANFPSRREGSRKSSPGRPRALHARLPASVSDIVIAKVQEALADAMPPSNSSWAHARLDYLKANIFSKYSDPLPGEEYVEASVRQLRAIEKWQKAEQRNAATNCRLTDGTIARFTTKRVNGRRSRSFTSDMIIDRARVIVQSVLGVKPPGFLGGLFTNGASTRVKRSPTSIAEKFEGRPHGTTGTTLSWSGVFFDAPGWGHLHPEGVEVEVVEGSVLFTVPKNSQIDRVACKEPEVNSYLQRGIGDFIRKRLKSRGIDLNDQTVNQNLARVAWSSRLATVDLSSASDTISRELVRALLPSDWYKLLDSVRSHSVQVPGSEYRHNLEMFSSMGNGFTFELESLIFWALTRTVSALIHAKGRISVYGDDIICPIPTAKMLTRVFPFFGFTVNRSKSCISGGYRESCGAHWYFGDCVKPFFVREKPRELDDVIRLGNQLLFWMSKAFTVDDIPLSFYRLWGFISTIVGPSLFGGQSFERSDSLVTGHAPRRLIARKMRSIDAPQSGAYLSWHHGASRSRCEPLVTSCALLEGRWVLRPNRSWYDRDVVWSAQQILLHGLSQV